MSVLCFLAVAIFIVLGFFNCKDESLYKGKGAEYTEPWYWEKSDGTVEEFTFPVSLDVKTGDAVRFYTVLPDHIDSGMYMIFQSGRNLKAYLDGELIYTHSHSKWFPGDTVKSYFIPVPLPDDCEGKTLTIVRDEPDANNGNMNKVYLSDLYTTASVVTEGKTALFIMGLFLALISLLTIIIFGTLSKSYKNPFPILFIAMGILSCSLWLLFDSKVFQFAFNSYYFDGVTGYMLTLLIPIPFCHYLDLVQEKKYKVIYAIIQLILVLSFILFAVLHFADIISYENTLLPIDLLVAISISLMFFIVIYDMTHYSPCHYKPVAAGLAFLMIMTMCEIIFINVSPTKNSSADGFFIVTGLYALLTGAIIDQLSHLKAIELETQAALASSKAKTTFLANMSHEIRTPINAIMGLNEMIIKETDNEEVRSHALDVATASKNLLEIINDILDFSKIEAGKMEIIKKEYNIGVLINSIKTMIELKASDKNLLFVTEVDSKLPTLLEGDEKHLREVMINILNNAVKYTPEGQITFTVGGYCDAENTYHLKASIKDTGIGIKPSDLKKLFSEFERFDLSQNRNIEGSGLGLAITKKLVDLMGGEISVESEYGKGSTFTVDIPQTVISDKPLGDYSSHKELHENLSSESVAQFKAPNAKVLIVDDNKMNLTVTKGLLKDTEVRLTTIASGEQMLHLITKVHFDIIFLDHMMPIMDGIETLHRARKLDNNLCKDTPVIALTANAIVGAKEEYIKEGFTDYLSKPVQSNDLISMLIKYL